MSSVADGLTPTSVYVHFPWCEKRCPYCDFATRAAPRESLPHTAYADAVLAELEAQQGLEHRGLLSIFVGGGTPSLWSPDEVRRVLQAIKSAFPQQREALETTLECNPHSFTQDRAEAFATAGVTRFSVGVQSLCNDELRFLGRLHDRKQALHATEIAVKTGAAVSADVMFGATERSPKDFIADLQTLLDLGVTHISAYALTVEPATPFGARARRGQLRLASEDMFAEAFLAASNFLSNQGFEHYEVSNYGKGKHRCRHNEHYWQGGDYLGLGAGAVGCLSHGQGRAVRTRNVPSGERYLQGTTDKEAEALEVDDLIREAWMLGLRTQAGISRQATADRLGKDPVEGRQQAIERRTASGDLVKERGMFRVPQERWLHLDGIVADLF